jgi:MinD superfamily P-loop ATPase
MTRALGIPFGVILNRQGLGNDDSLHYCRWEGIPIVLSIPDDRRIAQAYAEGNLLVEALPCYETLFADGWRQISSLCAETVAQTSSSGKTGQREDVTT